MLDSELSKVVFEPLNYVLNIVVNTYVIWLYPKD